MKNTDYIIAMVGCSSMAEALKIKKALLKERKVACVNIIPEVRSFFWWKGKIDSAGEVLLLAKTKSNMFKKIIALIEKIHSYEVPEIIALPIIGGNEKYLNWISKSLRR